MKEKKDKADVRPAGRQGQDELENNKQRRTSLEDAAAALTPEQVATIVDQWTMSQFCTDESIGDLLLVIKAVVFRKEEADREQVLRAIENLLMPYSPTASQSLDNIVARRLKVVREW